MTELEYIIQIEREFHEIINRHFPQMRISQSGSSGAHFHADYSTNNSAFKNSEYYYTGDLEFFHLTNYRNLFSILNSRIIRMYNLHNSNDPQEYKYSSDLFDASLQQVNSRKDNIYTFSFCPISEINNQRLWKHYGDDYKGVAITFKIDNDISKWDNFHIATIQYHSNDKIKLYVDEIKSLRKKYPQCTFDLGLDRVMGFHKEEKWNEEKEVRILTHNKFNSIFERLKFSKPELKIENNRNRFTEYFELSLFVDNDAPILNPLNVNPKWDRKHSLPDQYFITTPKIIITNIKFGFNCGLSQQEFHQFKNRIMDMIEFNLGYRIQIDSDFIEPITK